MYHAPLEDTEFVLHRLLKVEQLSALPRYAEFTEEVSLSVLREAARFAEAELDPANVTGDREGARFVDGAVRVPAAFRSAYTKFIEGGWPQLAVDTDIGGQGAPVVLNAAVEEIWCGANLAFALCPGLARGAIETLQHAGTPELIKRFLARLVSGEWTGTMNLTEPHAGSDVGLLRTRAVAEADHYLIKGQKIFITYGDHDMAPNIVHLVLARIEGAPSGVRGISLFLVPKFLVGADGQQGAANDLHCVSIEHKLGIHGSPTCVMSYGDEGGAVGYLLGEPNHGLQYMFIMMNAARLGVGIQGVGLSERAAQQALAWAQSRLQGRSPGAAGEGPQPIIQHPDVKRMLLTLQSGVEAMRALALYAALQLDLARGLADAGERRRVMARADLLTPIVKGYCTERAVELTSLAVQVHGGMGYIEETGVAQSLRDARITAIYEGTTAIQANDLIGRKLALDGGAAFRALLQDVAVELAPRAGDDALVTETKRATLEAVATLAATGEALRGRYAEQPAAALAVAVPFLMLCGRVLGGWLLARSAEVLSEAAAPAGAFAAAKRQKARFYASWVLPEVQALAQVIRNGGASVNEAEVRLLVLQAG